MHAFLNFSKTFLQFSRVFFRLPMAGFAGGMLLACLWCGSMLAASCEDVVAENVAVAVTPDTVVTDRVSETESQNTRSSDIEFPMFRLVRVLPDSRNFWRALPRSVRSGALPVLPAWRHVLPASVADYPDEERVVSPFQKLCRKAFPVRAGPRC